ncbi:MAG TPA: DUF1800 domain-containing protein [Janthinobacterium sp.]|nr:DUF1800 domain-containing protein [Janthinobacterium sp.]
MIHPETEQNSGVAKAAGSAPGPAPHAAGAMVGAALLLSACGGGGGTAAQTDGQSQPTAPVDTPIADADAARFLAQASMGASRAQMAVLQTQGYAGWIDAQFALPASDTRWDWLMAKGFNGISNQFSEAGFDAAMWRKLITSPDTLRQRVALALSEIAVVAIGGLDGAGWHAFSAAAYMDLLEANAFGNYRTLLDQISTSAAMGQFLTFRGNLKANPVTGALPDENYARELMQLFTIGLVQLNIDGTPKPGGGLPQDTYGQDDVTGLARVFTGWDFDMAGHDATTPDFMRRPMIQFATRHENGAANFLGGSVPAGLGGAAAMKAALDIIFAHPNVAPFISRQLIQKLVTSNPSPAYVARVATVFNNDGAGVKGNLRAVVKTLLLDPEARQGKPDTAFGKLREPMLRFLAWARAYGATSASDAWNIGNTSDPAARLGQSPLRSPSVFNFFRPGYVPPNSAIATAALVAPEFQLANESSVVGYVNYMQRAVGSGIGDVKADYTALLALADNAAGLLAEINVVLAAGQLSAETVSLLRGALDGMPAGTDARRLNRIYAALTLVLAAPEFLVQK